MRGLSAVLLLVPLGVLAQPPPRALRLAAVGDVIFGRYVRPEEPRSYVEIGRGEIFAEVAPLLRGADVGLANLETPILPPPPRITARGAHVFRADPDRARALRLAGLGVLSLANNHSSNLGLAGAAETRRRLIEEGLRPVGAGATEEEALQPALIDAGGLRLAVLAFTLWNGDHAPEDRGGALAYVSAAELLRRAAPLLSAARAVRGADWVVVSLHWGVEHAARADEEQRRLGRALIDAGADVVIGHHPHVLQEVERYRGGLIAYSLGNFVFDNRALPARQSVVLRLTLCDAGPARRIDEVRLVPVLIGRDGNPRPATGADHRALLERLQELAPGIAVLPDPATRLARAPRGAPPEW